MGVIGKFLGGHAGKAIGHFAGKKVGHITGVGAKRGSKIGRTIGQGVGSLLPFKKGGRVRKTGPALVHKGEFVLPKGVRPTKKQVSKVRKKHR